MRNTVRYVRKLIRRIIIKILKNAFLDNIAVERRNTVYTVTSHNTEICHTHRIMRKNGHSGNFVPISGILFPKIVAEAAVDFF